jgi:hypothetical protein
MFVISLKPIIIKWKTPNSTKISKTHSLKAKNFLSELKLEELVSLTHKMMRNFSMNLQREAI